MDRKLSTEADRAFHGGAVLRVRTAVGAFPEALARVAKYVLDNPEKVVRGTVVELAAFSRIGEASVVRFCRAIGYGGFRDFKLALAEDLARRGTSDPAGHAETLEGSLDRLARSLVVGIGDTRQAVDMAALRRLALRLAASARIDVYGAGRSGFVATMLAYRLQRLGRVAQAFPNAILAHEVMGRGRSDITAIAISTFGLTTETIQFLAGARSVGAFTVALTGRPLGPLGVEADVVLFAPPVEPPPQGGELTDLVGKLFLIEALGRAIEEL